MTASRSSRLNASSMSRTTSTFSCDIARAVSTGEGDGHNRCVLREQTAGWLAVKKSVFIRPSGDLALGAGCALPASRLMLCAGLLAFGSGGLTL